MPKRRIAATALAVAIASSLVIGVAARTGAGRHVDPERSRIRAHLLRVEDQLRRRDTATLSPTQKRARARHLDVLHRYALRGRFPVNHDFPDARTPYFVDRHGTRCAVAWLIERSGHGDLVGRVAATRNNARVRDLAADPELRAWLATAGLTLAEAARIQPSYRYRDPYVRVENGRYLGLAAATSLAEIAIIAFNCRTDRPWELRRNRALLGFAAGAAGVGVGAHGIADQDATTKTMGAFTLALSSAALAFSLQNLNTHPRRDREPSVAHAVRPRFYVRGTPDGPQLAARVRF